MVPPNKHYKTDRSRQSYSALPIVATATTNMIQQFSPTNFQKWPLWTDRSTDGKTGGPIYSTWLIILAVIRQTKRHKQLNMNMW